MMNRRTFIFAGLAVALVIGAMAPFVASGNPDGLESAFFGIFGAKEIHGAELDEQHAAAAEEKVVEITGNDYAFVSPFPDYSIGELAKVGEAGAVIIGTVVVMAIAFVLARIVRKPG